MLDLSEDLSLGDEKDEATLFYGPMRFDVDPKGNIYVIDNDEKTRKFDREGKLVFSVLGRLNRR